MGVDGEVVVEDYDQPKCELVGRIGAFVPETTLREKRAGPTAQQFPEVEHFFGDAPFAPLGAAFVPSVEAVGDGRRQHDPAGQRPSEIRPKKTGNGDAGRNQEDGKHNKVGRAQGNSAERQIDALGASPPLAVRAEGVGDLVPGLWVVWSLGEVADMGEDAVLPVIDETVAFGLVPFGDYAFAGRVAGGFGSKWFYV